MKKAAAVAIAILFSIAVPAVAENYADNARDTQSDAEAIQKDNVAIMHDQQNLESNRAAKAADKANDDSAQQAVDSLKIGANKTAIHEKKTEKDIDQRIMTHDEQQ